MALETFDEYQDLAERTSGDHTTLADRLCSSALGLAGEAGEVVEIIKKHRYHGRVLDYEAMHKELGDVLWYVAELCSALGFNLSAVAGANIQKLKERYPDGFVRRFAP